ncbi:MAG TPA: isoprenylcysteine carboxylmethyltransferase family protein [Methylomirabilota bacterium]|nr:isoprenylcysteine carboxylmethyltransferase family protein [Methylomirabilota bacterium]
MPPDDLVWRQIIVSGSALVYWGGVLVQARRIRKRIGRSANLKPRGFREKALWFGWMLVIVGWVTQPLVAGREFIAPWLPGAALLGHMPGLLAGAALNAVGYAGTLWCYAAMGSAWRIGVNRREKNALVVTGPYRWVRHPIYGLQMVMLAGAVLLLPTVLALGILVLHYLCARIKALDEESYLLEVHGAAYRDYRRHTGRFFPRSRGFPPD